ncbi:MAG TPA: hypothetical protein VD927_08490 [Chryseosolibacter sp.]|nr:hypothetical protein [Chryseosolibacter sp.]
MTGINIPGIHNYCDRWCEKCPFTSRCAAFEGDASTSAEERDFRNEAFWKRLSENFSKAKVVIEDMAAKHGIDVNALAHEADQKLNEELVDKKADDHPVSKLTWEYSTIATDWLKTQPGMLDKLEKLKVELTMGVESHEEAKIQAHTIKDSLAVIHWYATFIHVKFKRAIRGKIEFQQWDDDDDDVQRDYNGSAKIAIIAIERSIQAWVEIFNLLPEQEDLFLKILGMLDKCKRLIIEEFPDALKFVRPGFDEISGMNVL